MRALTLALALIAYPLAARATLIVDQQQTGIDATFPLLEIGGPQDKRLAQTFTVGLEGVFSEVHLPIQCESGVLMVEIVNVAGGVPVPEFLSRWDRGLKLAADLPPMETPEFRAIPLVELPPVPGDRFPPGSASYIPPVGMPLALVISNPTGRCTMYRGVAVDPYAGGRGFFDERPTERDWDPLTGNIEPSDDLPFKTVMDADPPSPPCDLFGLTANPIISNFLPICRCLEDESLLETRCALLHPSFFLIRRVPFPIVPGEPFLVSWTVTPLGDLTGDIELKEILPKELQASLKKPLVFRANQMKPGRSITIDYKAVALSGKGGTFGVDTLISAPSAFEKPDVMRMHSLIEVEPPKK